MAPSSDTVEAAAAAKPVRDGGPLAPYDWFCEKSGLADCPGNLVSVGVHGLLAAGIDGDDAVEEAIHIVILVVADAGYCS